MMLRTPALVALACLALPRPFAALLVFVWLCSFRSLRVIVFGSFALLCALFPWVFFGVCGLWLAWLLWCFVLALVKSVVPPPVPSAPSAPLRLRGGAFPDEEDEEDDEDEDDLEESFLIFANVDGDAPVASTSGGFAVPALPVARCYQRRAATSTVSSSGAVSVAPAVSSSGGVAMSAPPTEGSSSPVVSSSSGGLAVISRPIARAHSRRVSASVVRSVAPVAPTSGGVALVAPHTEGSSSLVLSPPLGGSSVAPAVSSSGGVAMSAPPTEGSSSPVVSSSSGGLAVTFRPIARARSRRVSASVVRSVAPVAPTSGGVAMSAPHTEGSSYLVLSPPLGGSSVAPVVTSSSGVALVAPLTEGSSSSLLPGSASLQAGVLSSGSSFASDTLARAPAPANAGSTGDDDADAVVPGGDGGAGARPVVSGDVMLAPVLVPVAPSTVGVVSAVSAFDGGASARLFPAGGVLASAALPVVPTAVDIFSVAAARSVWSVVDPFDEDVVMAFGEPDWMDVDDEEEGGRVYADLEEVWDPMDIQEDAAWPLPRSGRRRMTALRKRGCRRRLMALPLGVPAYKFAGPYIVPWYKGSSSGWGRR
ncbi:hypothetical protein K501DRAFT_333650 [Backusella circina FSU 941]|nr:hypothetical protein K501DRAFT_333650 [Backusella circina FSU 941]